MTNGQMLGVIFFVVLVAGAVFLMLRSWRNRLRRDAHLRLGGDEGQLGDVQLNVPILHLATTRAHDPLERLTLPGLAYRARGVIEVREHGVALRLSDANDVAVSAHRIVGAGTAAWVIDRAVGAGRLVVVTWFTRNQPAELVDSYFRPDKIDDVERLVLEVSRLAESGKEEVRE